MTANDAAVRAGCLDCLEQALDDYLALRSDATVGPAATEAAFRTALLIAVRENELGLLDSGRLELAGTLLPSPVPELALLRDVARALALKPRGSSRAPLSDEETRASISISRNQHQWAPSLRQRIPDDFTAAYLWLGLACGPYGFDVPERTERPTVLGDTADIPLMRFKNASACSIQQPALQAMLDGNPRFGEANYFIGVGALSTQLLDGADEAEQRFQAAYDWRSNWPSLTMAIANLALTAENFDRAIDFYDKTLSLIANHPEALLGSIRAFTYVGRHGEAIAAADRLLNSNRNPGEARYWRALNEEQMDQHDAAWADIELASQAMVSPDVPKLAGIIAINRRELEVARQRLELALTARPTDCETAFYLEAIRTQQGQWAEAALTASNAAACLDGDLARLAEEIASLRASNLRADRRDRQIAKREQQVASATRRRAASWYDAAASNYNLSRRDEARKFAEKLMDDDQYRDRARELLARLSAQ